MARPLYSVRFIGLAATGPATAEYEVPAGYVAVLRDVTADFAATSGSALLVSFGAGPFYVMALGGSASGGGIHQWQGRQVIEAGETLVAEFIGDQAQTVVCSGYLLTI